MIPYHLIAVIAALALCIGFFLGWICHNLYLNVYWRRRIEKMHPEGALPLSDAIPPMPAGFTEGKMSKGGLNDPPKGPRPTSTGPKRPTGPPNLRLRGK